MTEQHGKIVGALYGPFDTDSRAADPANWCYQPLPERDVAEVGSAPEGAPILEEATLD